MNYIYINYLFINKSSKLLNKVSSEKHNLQTMLHKRLLYVKNSFFFIISYCKINNVLEYHDFMLK